MSVEAVKDLKPITEAPPQKKVWTKYILLSGSHSQIDKDGVHRLYRRGELTLPPPVVESEYNLAAKWPEKFRRYDAYMPDERPQQEQAPGLLDGGSMMKALEKMDVKNLIEWAEGEEIDLKGEKGKDGILKIIRKELALQPA